MTYLENWHNVLLDNNHEDVNDVNNIDYNTESKSSDNNLNLDDTNTGKNKIKFIELESESQEMLDSDFESQEIQDTEPYMSSYKKYENEFMTEIQIEPILSCTSERYTVFPIKYKNIWEMYKLQIQLNWSVEEVVLYKDIEDWENKLDDNDRTFLMHVLAFFSAADGIVNANIKQNLIDVVKIKEAECAYGKQFEMENVHGEMYSLMLDTFIKDEALKNKLIDSIKTMPAIRKKAMWCKKWIDSDKTYAHKLVAFAIVEGIFFSGSFASIFWLKTRQGSIMPGLRKSNKFIARDESMHVELACRMYSLLKNKLKESVVHEILEEAILYEDEFINASLPCKLLGMNSDLMSQYIKYCADRLLVQLGYPKKYKVELPFEFMKKIDSFCKENFFENRNDAYSDAKIDNPRLLLLLDNGY